MRYQGRIANWKDDRGFGFIAPSRGGEQAFVHISSFANRSRRPIGNDAVTYELGFDAQGRPQALEVSFVGDRPQQRATGTLPVVRALSIAGIFLAAVALCCGHQYGDDDQFRVFTDPRQPVARKLFRKIDVTAQLTHLVGAVDAILSADPDIRELSWRTP